MAQGQLSPENTDKELQAFYRELEEKNLVALWNITASLMPAEPKTKVQPFLWRWPELRGLAYRAGDLVPIERGGERRVLALVNPGLGGKPVTTHTLWAAVQIDKPGEIAPCHRHTPCAIRFIIEGDRSYTNINGDKCMMDRGDLVLTPNWAWHEHANERKDETILFSIQDTPVMKALGLYREEAYAEQGGHQKITGTFNS